MAFNEKYTYTIYKNFDRKASKLKGATSTLASYIQVDHKRSEDASISSIEKVQSGLNKFIKSKEDIPDFEDAIVK
jgi:hypothetical protein